LKTVKISEYELRYTHLLNYNGMPHPAYAINKALVI